MLAVWGPKTRVLTVRLPNLMAPLTRALAAVCPENWKMVESASKYLDSNWINEHRYILYWWKLYSVKSRQERIGVSSLLQGQFEG